MRTSLWHWGALMGLHYATLHNTDTGLYRFFIYTEDGEIGFESESIYTSEAAAAEATEEWIRRKQAGLEP
jgi:hypothetical protein